MLVWRGEKNPRLIIIKITSYSGNKDVWVALISQCISTSAARVSVRGTPEGELSCLLASLLSGISSRQF